MKHLQKILSVLLMLAILLGMTACQTAPATTKGPNLEQPGTTATQPATQPTTQPTVPPTTQPTVPPTTQPTVPPTTQPTVPPTTQPTEPPKVWPEPEPLVYVLTQEDVDTFYRLLSEMETLAIAGVDMDAIELANEALDDQYNYLNAQNTIAMILYYANMEDEALTQQHLDCVEICSNANDAYIQMTRRVYMSDTPAKDMLFEGWTQEDLDQLMAYDERIAALQQRNAEISVEYNSASRDETRIPLYIEFVQNNNEIARFYGYDNYYTYAYEQVYDRDYDVDGLVQLRGYAKEYLTETLKQAQRNFNNSFQRLSSAMQESVLMFLYDDYDSMYKNYVDIYLDAMPETMSDTMYTMLYLDSMFVSMAGAREGAFTTMIGDRSYCYFGPGYASTNTVLHEAGHYYASRFADLNSIPLDLAETHSQGNEWLFMEFLQDHLGQTQYDAIVNYRLYNDLAMIMICLMVDEFEQIVYSTDLTGYTAADFDAIMSGVVNQYFDSSYMSSIANISMYWRQVVVDQPVYYISYGVSSIAAMDLYTLAVEDFDAALVAYQKLCEEPQEGGFLANITAAGLSGPFDEEFYQELAELINNRKG